MSVQLPRERVMVIKPLLDWSCLLLQLWNMDPCCELKSQSKALINGKSSSSELFPCSDSGVWVLQQPQARRSRCRDGRESWRTARSTGEGQAEPGASFPYQTATRAAGSVRESPAVLQEAPRAHKQPPLLSPEAIKTRW